MTTDQDVVLRLFPAFRQSVAVTLTYDANADSYKASIGKLG